MRTLVDANREVHRQATQRWTLHLHVIRIFEVDELHKSVELVVGGERRVAQYVCDVRRTEHVKTTTEAQGIKRTIGKTEEVDIRLAEGF